MPAAPPKRLLGSERPRIFTPPLRKLTQETTLGFDAIDFAEDVLGIELYPWQKWLLIHILELLPSGILRFRKVIVLVGRQNGKSTVGQVLALYFMWVLAVPRVLGTAQDLGTAEEIWQDTLEMARESDALAPFLTRPKLGKGSKEFGLYDPEDPANLAKASRYLVKAANRRGGRGARKVRLVLLDELREHQTWDAWAAITKTTNAEPEALIAAFSNAGDVQSVVLRYLRMMCHKALGDPDGVCAAADPAALLDESRPDVDKLAVREADQAIGIFEWSAPPDCDVWDRPAWGMANPTLGHGGVTERTLASDAGVDPEWTFRTEVLCQWSDAALDGPFPPGAWDAGKLSLGEAALAESQIVGDVVACVEVSWDRAKAAVVFAGRRQDGLPQGEVVHYRYDPRAAVEWLASPERTVRPVRVAVRSNAPAATLEQALKDAGFEVVAWVGADVSEACGALYDSVRGGEDETCGELRHTAHTALDVAAGVAVTKPFGDRWSWDMAKSPVDIAPLVALTGAVWLLGKPSSFRSAYDDHDLIVI